jgi:hypothetical protein
MVPSTKEHEAPPQSRGRKSLKTLEEILVADKLGMWKMIDLPSQAIDLPGRPLAWASRPESPLLDHLLRSVRSMVFQPRRTDM